MNKERIDPIVNEIIQGMSDREKRIVRTTPKHDLVSSLFAWAQRSGTSTSYGKTRNW